jgi:hypothetical protein
VSLITSCQCALELGVPTWLTGIHEQERARLEKNYMSKHYPDALQSLADMEEAISHANESLSLATAAAQNECGFPNHVEFKKYFDVATEPAPGELEGAARTAAQEKRDAARQAIIDQQNEKMVADYCALMAKSAVA